MPASHKWLTKGSMWRIINLLRLCRNPINQFAKLPKVKSQTFFYGKPVGIVNFSLLGIFLWCRNYVRYWKSNCSVCMYSDIWWSSIWYFVNHVRLLLWERRRIVSVVSSSSFVQYIERSCVAICDECSVVDSNVLWTILLSLQEG